MHRLPLALVFLLVGCSDSSNTPATDALAASAASDAEVHYLVYRCESGAEIQATYPDLESAEIIYGGQAHPLDFLPASPKNGAEYANETWSWLTSRSEGVLTRVGSDEEVERCEQGA